MRPFPILAALLLFGCAPKPASTEVPVGTTAPASGGVAPMTGGAAAGMTPVSGSESVEGAGSGVNQSAIGAAQKAAAKSGSAPSLGGDPGGE